MHVSLSLQSHNALHWSSLTKKVVDKDVNVCSHNINIQAGFKNIIRMKSVTKQMNVLSRAKGSKKAYNEINYVRRIFLPLAPFNQIQILPHEFFYLKRVSIILLSLVLLQIHSSVNKTKK